MTRYILPFVFFSIIILSSLVASAGVLPLQSCTVPYPKTFCSSEENAILRCSEDGAMSNVVERCSEGKICKYDSKIQGAVCTEAIDKGSALITTNIIPLLIIVLILIVIFFIIFVLIRNIKNRRK